MKLKSWTLALTFALATLARAATNDLTGLLQKGLFEEEANRDLTAAIANYQSLASAFDKDRQLAATAIFRLGECYRKLGNTNEAVVQYQRIIKEFSDQQTLATLSQQNLAGLKIVSKPNLPDAYNTELAAAEANEASLQSQLDTIQKLSRDQARVYVVQNFPNPILNSELQQLDSAEQKLIELKLNYTDDHPNMKNAREIVKDLNSKIDAQVEGVVSGLQSKLAAAQVQRDLQRKRQSEIAGTTGGGGGSSGESVTTDEEQQEIRRIQLMIQNSPDLINATGGGPNGNRTPLEGAAEKGQLIVAKYLLDHGADVSGRSNNSRPLVAAAANGQKAMVELLLARGADVNAGGLNPLYEAVQKGYVAVAEVLLADKADVNLRGAGSSGARPIHRAVLAGGTGMLQLLINHGADVNVSDDQGRTPLDYAVMQNEIAAAKTLLAAKAAVDAEDKGGNTSLHDAADKGSAEMVSLLLNSGATVDATNNNNATPLLLAVYHGSVEATRVLLEHKADPNHLGRVKNLSNEGLVSARPVYRAIEKNNIDILKLLLDAGASPEGAGTSPLFYAISYNAVEAVRLLLEHGADPNHVENGWPAISTVIRDLRDKRIITLLLDKGANPNATDPDHNTPLSRASDPDVARWLIEHKADVNARSATGSTVVMSSIWHTNCLKVLLENGAQADLQENNGNTALHNAVYYSLPTAVAILLEAKANPNIQNNLGYTPRDLAEAGKTGQRLDPLMAAYLINNNTQPPSRDTQTAIAELLIKAGGLVNLPKRDRIEVRRGANARFVIRKDSQGRNRYSLLEVIASSYGVLTQQASGNWVRDHYVKAEMFARYNLPFPELKKVVIYRSTGNSTKQTAISSDVENILSTADCSRDQLLEWGDVVEIPEADHPVDQAWPGLSYEVVSTLANCVSREVTIKINNESVKLKLAPEYKAPPSIYLTRASFILRSVLDNSGLIRVSSDLSRVKVTRTDPSTKKTTEWIVDCTENNQSDLWLRDGDVVEVPEK